MSPFMWILLETNLGLGSFRATANPFFEGFILVLSLEGKT